ncbi:hypothetical protein D3C74_214980 [compost metagenome]
MGLVISVIVILAVFIVIKMKYKNHSQDEVQKKRILRWLEHEKGFSPETLQRMEIMNLEHLQLVIMQQNLLNEQEMQRIMHEPYLHQGLDPVVDRYYHGVDNGLDQHQNFHNDNYNNGSGNNGF